MAEWLGGWWLVPNLQHHYPGLTTSHQVPVVKAASHPSWWLKPWWLVAGEQWGLKTAAGQ